MSAFPHSTRDVLLDARGFDVPEDLAPDSFTVINELLLTARQRPRP